MKSTIDPAVGLDLVPARTLEDRQGTVAVLIPAHNEEATVAEVVSDAFKSLKHLRVDGEVIVSASGCTDDTARAAAKAGAQVVEAPTGKGSAIAAGLQAVSADIVCLIDGDLRYFGDPPLAATLVSPILRGICDATIATLYWRPIYPQLWLNGFFLPLAGRLFPEILPKVGTTPWSGQRAALSHMWPSELPTDYTVDLALLVHWNDLGSRLRPVATDDWTHPIRPKPEVIVRDFEFFVRHAIARGRIPADRQDALEQWFTNVHDYMAEYRHDIDDPTDFERKILLHSLAELERALSDRAA